MGGEDVVRFHYRTDALWLLREASSFSGCQGWAFTGALPSSEVPSSLSSNLDNVEKISG
jgi:hypothetical protein